MHSAKDTAEWLSFCIDVYTTECYAHDYHMQVGQDLLDNGQNYLAFAHHEMAVQAMNNADAILEDITC